MYPKPFDSLFNASTAVLLLTLIAVSFPADTATSVAACTPNATAPQLSQTAAGYTGRVIILPGVGNTKFHLAGFVERARQQLPDFAVEVRSWGIPFLTLHNLRAHQKNLTVARQIAAEIVDWRRSHPDELLYLVGYSGGGGMAGLVVSELPDGISIDRLLLVAAAISPTYPIEQSVLPRVNEFVANFSSERDLQVGLGTRIFGTIDRVNSDSAGAVGFVSRHQDLLEWRWSPPAQEYGHHGNHLSYLGRRWQDATLLPTLDPRLSAEQIVACWSLSCGV